jgi:hypothetical protein
MSHSISRTLASAGLFGLLLTTAACAPARESIGRGAVEPHVAHAAAALELTTLQGERFLLADQRGKRVMLVFWSPARPGAASEIRDIAALAEHVAPEIVVVCVAVLAGTNASERDIAPMLVGKAKNLHIAVMGHAHDAPDWAEAMNAPLFALVDGSGVVRARGTDAIDWRDRATADKLRDLAAHAGPRRTALHDRDLPGFGMR